MQLAPRIVTADTPADERNDVYLGGGVLFVTSRILVVDFLTGKIPADLISGLFVVGAERVSPTTSEAFVLRLFRYTNQQGFIRAFSEHPEALQSGADSLMKAMWLTKLQLWPRFERSIVASLSTHAPRFEEIRIPMTPSMKSIQTSLVDILMSCLRELKRVYPGVSATPFSFEQGVAQHFDRSLRSQLDAVWHTLGKKAKQLVCN